MLYMFVQCMFLWGGGNIDRQTPSKPVHVIDGPQDLPFNANKETKVN